MINAIKNEQKKIRQQKRQLKNYIDTSSNEKISEDNENCILID